MSAVEEFEDAREDLEALLVEVLGPLFGEEAALAFDEPPPSGPVVSARLAIHDEVEDSYTQVEVRTSAIVARILASRMMITADPSADDMLDAVAELGNIVGGNVKSLLRHSCRLSLPTAEVTEGGAGALPPVHGVTVQASVLGQVVELVVSETENVSGLYWPGASHDEALEKQS